MLSIRPVWLMYAHSHLVDSYHRCSRLTGGKLLLPKIEV